MKERLIVVGKNSYVGKCFTEFAVSEHREVIALGSRDCDFLVADEVMGFFKGLDDVPHTVVFFAVINKSVESSYRSMLANIQIVKPLIEGCQLANIASVVYISSVDVYGVHPELPITEQSQINPDTWYGLAKSNCEWMLSTSGEVTFPVTILRIPGIFGYAPNDKSVILRMVERILKEGRVVINGGGKARRDFVWTDDLCRLLWRLLPLKYDGVLNAATGRCHTIHEVVDLIGQVLDVSFKVEYVATDTEREFDLVYDNRALMELLPGFEFESLEEGIGSYQAVLQMG